MSPIKVCDLENPAGAFEARDGAATVRVAPCHDGRWEIAAPGQAKQARRSEREAAVEAGAMLADLRARRTSRRRPRSAAANPAAAARADELDRRGMSLRAIAAALALEGLAGAPGRPISPDGVRRLLGRL